MVVDISLHISKKGSNSKKEAIAKKGAIAKKVAIAKKAAIAKKEEIAKKGAINSLSCLKVVPYYIKGWVSNMRSSLHIFIFRTSYPPS